MSTTLLRSQELSINLKIHPVLKTQYDTVYLQINEQNNVFIAYSFILITIYWVKINILRFKSNDSQLPLLLYQNFHFYA